MITRPLALACALGATAMLPVLADQVQVKLDADTGLWEVTTHGQSNGAPLISEDDLQKLPPEQRERLKAAMQAAMAQAMKGRTMHECLTPEQRARGFDVGDDSSSCKTTVVKNTSTELEVHKECATDNDRSRITERFHMSGRRQVSGTVDVVQSRAGNDLTLHTNIEGKWLGRDCGNVKDAEIVK